MNRRGQDRNNATLWRRSMNRRSILNSNRRRRVMNRRRMLNSGRQRLNSAVAGDIVTFNELNYAQKQSAIENIWNTKGAEWIYESYNEDVMDRYSFDLNELTAQYNKLISDVIGQNYEIDDEQLYWNSTSQGPYPDWKFSDVFSDFTIEYLNNTKTVSNQTPSSNGKPPVEAIDVVFSAYGDKLDVWSGVSFDSEYYSVEDEDWLHETAIDPGDEFTGFVADIAIPSEAVSKITRAIGYMQEYIDAVWSMVREVCTETPDYDYAYDLYETNDWGDFEIIDDQTAEYYNDYPEDDFNTYL